MKKTLFLFLFFFSLLYAAQSKYTAEQVEKTNDIKVIANFIKNNPNHPKTPAFKQKLANIVMRENQTVAKSAAENYPPPNPLQRLLKHPAKELPVNTKKLPRLSIIFLMKIQTRVKPI
jgi:hypothetical protein